MDFAFDLRWLSQRSQVEIKTASRTGLEPSKQIALNRGLDGRHHSWISTVVELGEGFSSQA
jgi:hypothetical protein